MKEKKHLLMAQTTRLASFGPVIVVVAPTEPLRTFRASVVPIYVIK